MNSQALKELFHITQRWKLFRNIHFFKKKPIWFIGTLSQHIYHKARRFCLCVHMSARSCSRITVQTIFLMPCFQLYWLSENLSSFLLGLLLEVKISFKLLNKLLWKLRNNNNNNHKNQPCRNSSSVFSQLVFET